MLFQWFIPSQGISSEKKIITFSIAKSLLSKKIYGNKAKTFYCGCQYQRKSIVRKSCKIFTKKFKKRGKRLEWEHVVPAHAFGQSFKEWRNSKKLCPGKKSPRKCAGKLNRLYKEMEGNIHNLVPAVGAINALRSNYSFSELDEGSSELLCASGFYKKKNKVMPGKSQKGDIARIYLYMDQKYPGRGVISRKNKKLFDAWDKVDPVSKEECQLSKIKGEVFGERNMLVESRCKGI